MDEVCPQRGKMKNYKTDRFDAQKATESELKAYYDFFMKILEEARPDDPKRPYEKFKKQILNHSESVTVKRWVIREDELITAYIILYFQKEGENKHVTEGDIFVLPELRRKGIGTFLLKKMYEEATKENCTMIDFSEFSTCSSGSEFLKEIGAKLGCTEHINQLKIADIDMKLMDEWIAKANERAEDYELEFWQNEIPEERMDSFLKLYNDFWNSVPLDDLEYEYEELSAERMRNGIKATVKKGWQIRTITAIHKPTQTPAGFTQTIFTGFNNEMLNQDDTGVAKEHRNKGLGRLLKAAMIKKIKEEMPSIKMIRSENAASNKPMLNINYQMGFKPYYSESYWQIKTDKLKEYLGSL